MANKYILLIGKSLLILKPTAALLRDRGYQAELTNDFDGVTSRFDVRQFDLVTFGAQVPEDKKAQIKHDILGLKSDMLFVQGLAPIPALIVQQIEGELATQERNTALAPTYNANNRTIVMLLGEPAPVKVTAWWLTSFTPPNLTSGSLVIVDQTKQAGKQMVRIPPAVPGKASFASVQINGAIYVLSLATPQT